MRFANVCVESIAAVLPPEVLSSAQIEERLAPLYARLKLPAGRLRADERHPRAPALAGGHAALGGERRGGPRRAGPLAAAGG